MNVLKILLNSCSLIETNPTNNTNPEELYKETLADGKIINNTVLLLTCLKYQREIFAKKQNINYIEEGDSQDQLNITEKSINTNFPERDEEEIKVEDIIPFMKIEKAELDSSEMLIKFSICHVVISFYFSVIKSLQVFGKFFLILQI
jgi:hypothetical protein